MTGSVLGKGLFRLAKSAAPKPTIENWQPSPLRSIGRSVELTKALAPAGLRVTLPLRVHGASLIA